MNARTKTAPRVFRPEMAIDHLLKTELKKRKTTVTLLIENAIAATYGKGQNILLGTRWEKYI